MSASNANRLVYKRPTHRRLCHKIRLNPTPKTSGNQFRNPTRNPIWTQQSQNKPKKRFQRFQRAWEIFARLESQTGEYLFSTLQKTKTHHTSWSKTKETQSGQVSESPEREKNAAKRERARERKSWRRRMQQGEWVGEKCYKWWREWANMKVACVGGGANYDDYYRWLEQRQAKGDGDQNKERKERRGKRAWVGTGRKSALVGRRSSFSHQSLTPFARRPWPNDQHPQTLKRFSFK